jgi:hypothetical protein
MQTIGSPSSTTFPTSENQISQTTMEKFIVRQEANQSSSLVDWQRGAWAMIFTILIINLFSTFIEAIYKTMYRPSTLPTSGKSPQEQNTEKPSTYGHRLANAARILHDSFLYLLTITLANQIGYGLNSDAVGMLWTTFALYVVWALVKLVIYSPFIDLGFSFVNGVFVIATMALAFR